MQDGNFGYIQISGYIDVQAGGTCTPGGDLTCNASGLVLDRTAFEEPLVGICVSASTGGLAGVVLSLASIP